MRHLSSAHMLDMYGLGIYKIVDYNERLYMSPKPKNTPHRVLLSLPTDLYQTISRVSAAMEKPRAEIIRDLLAEQQPILEHMATMLEQAKAGKLDQAMKGWQKMTGEALKGLGVLMTPPEIKKHKLKA